MNLLDYLNVKPTTLVSSLLLKTFSPPVSNGMLALVFSLGCIGMPLMNSSLFDQGSREKPMNYG